MKRIILPLFLALAFPAHAVWIYDSGTLTITKNGTSINVGVWSGKKLSIVDNRYRPEFVEIDLSDGIEDASGNRYTIQQINRNQGFQGCVNLRRFVMPAETASIGENNFRDCTSLGEFVVGASCSTVGWNCFNGATSLTNFAVPANSPLATLDPGSFTGCTSLTNFPFANCPNLYTIYIPESCTSIAANAFKGVNGLTIWGVAGSYAESYADIYGYDFVSVE